MSDCADCWDTPCTCGRGYRRDRMSLDRLREVVAAASRVLAEREQDDSPPVDHPRQQFGLEVWEVSVGFTHRAPQEFLDAARAMGGACRRSQEEIILAALTKKDGESPI